MSRKTAAPQADRPDNGQLFDGPTGGPDVPVDSREPDRPANLNFDPAEMEEVEEAAIADEKIVVGAGGILTIPREEVEDDDTGEEELGGSAVKIRRPGRREYIILDPALEMPTKLLIHRPKGEDTMDEEMFWIASKLRRDIKGELKPVRVFPFFSVQTRAIALWIVKVTLDNSWYVSLQDHLLRQPPDFFQRWEVRIRADKDAGRYRVFKRPRSVPTVAWSARPVGDLLAEALGASHIITDANHPLYQDLISGEEVK